MSVQEHSVGQTRSRRSPVVKTSGANGGSAKPHDDGKLIRQWCPSPFDDHREDREVPHTAPRHAHTPVPETLLN